MSTTSSLPDAMRVLCVFAHPDDEQFGTSGALLHAREQGAEVTVYCATRGDRGEISDPALATPETLGDVRAGELRRACALLGISPPIQRDFGDGQLASLPAEALEADVVETIRAVRPRVVITFDANGGYGHSDHIAVHRATVAAIPAAADPDAYPEAGAPHRVERLLVTAYNRSLLSRMNDDLVAHGFPALDFGSVQSIDAGLMGTDPSRITTSIDVDRFWPTRWAALRAHRTQYGPGNPFVTLPEATVRSWMARDEFVRLLPAPAPEATLPDEHGLLGTAA